MKIYAEVGDPSDADCLIGFSYGTSTHLGSVNDQLGKSMVDMADGRPMIADRNLVDALPVDDTAMAYIVDGDVTNLRAQGVGTWRIAEEAKTYMDENDLVKPLLITQAWHMRRVAKQAAKLGMDAIVPADLTAAFDHDSDQIWTRSALLWIPFNAAGSILLKKRGQL